MLIEKSENYIREFLQIQRVSSGNLKKCWSRGTTTK